jgi:hypothetical protein
MNSVFQDGSIYGTPVCAVCKKDLDIGEHFFQISSCRVMSKNEIGVPMEFTVYGAKGLGFCYNSTALKFDDDGGLISYRKQVVFHEECFAQIAGENLFIE